MEIAGEMQVDLVHRHDLRKAAAGRAALHAEAGAERGLAQADDGLFADPVERVAQAHRRRGLAFAGRRRIDRGDEDQLAVGLVGEAVDEIIFDLGDQAAIGMQRRLGNADFGADGGDGRELGGPRDFNVGLHRLWFPGPGGARVLAARRRKGKLRLTGAGPAGRPARQWPFETAK